MRLYARERVLSEVGDMFDGQGLQEAAEVLRQRRDLLEFDPEMAVRPERVRPHLRSTVTKVVKDLREFWQKGPGQGRKMSVGDVPLILEIYGPSPLSDVVP